jgi:fluoroquinolone transport system ATP-binding protein
MAGIGDNEGFLKVIKEKELETLHSGETSMEEIFIRVTGVKEV